MESLFSDDTFGWHLLLWAAGGYAFMFLSWILYLAIMNIAAHRDELYTIAKVHAYVLLVIGIIFDVFLNLTIGSLLFLEPPHWKRLLLSVRMDEHARNGHGWRKALAQWICLHLLNQFDPTGHHCGAKRVSQQKSGESVARSKSLTG